MRNRVFGYAAGMLAATRKQEEAPPLPRRTQKISPLRQIVRVTAVATSAGSTEKRFRSLTISGVLLALSGVGSVILVAWLGAPDAADIVALRVLAYGCWLYGGLGMWALLAPHSLRDEPNVLARMRGQEVDSWLMRALSFTRRLSVGMWLAGLPGLLTAAAVSHNAGAFAQRTALIAVSVLYLLSLSAVLGALGAFCLKASKRAPRSLAMSMVMIPFLLSFHYEGIPSIPGIYSWALRRMIDWGAFVS